MKRRGFLGKLRLLFVYPFISTISSCRWSETTETSSSGTTYFIREDGSVIDWVEASSADTIGASADLAFLHSNFDTLEVGDSLKLSSQGGIYTIGENIFNVRAVMHIQSDGLNYSAASGETVVINLNNAEGIEIASSAINSKIDLTNFVFTRTAGMHQYIHASNNSIVTLLNTTIVGNNSSPDGDGVSTDGDSQLTLLGVTNISNIKNGISTSEQALTTHGASLMRVMGEIYLSGNNTNMAPVNDSSMTIQCFGTIGASALPGKATLDNGSTGVTLIEAKGGVLTADAGNDVLFNCVLSTGGLICKYLTYINVSNEKINVVRGLLIIDGGTFDGIPRIRLNNAAANIEVKPGTIFYGGGDNEIVDSTITGASAIFRGIVKFNGQTGQLMDFSGGNFDADNTSISGVVIDCSQGASWVRANNGLFVLNNAKTLIHNIIIIGKPGTSMGKWLFDIKKDGCKFYNIILHDVELTDTNGTIFRDSGEGSLAAEFSHFIFSGTTQTASQTAAQLAANPDFPYSITTTYAATDLQNNDYKPTDPGLLSGGYDGENLPTTIELQDTSLKKLSGKVPFGSYKGV